MPIRIATFNMENLFSRPRVMNLDTWAQGKPALEAVARLNTLIEKASYSSADKTAMLKIIKDYGTGKDRAFDLVEVREKLYAPKAKKIVANGRADWTGWVELVRDDVGWGATENTARVIDAVQPDILLAVEVENRITLQRFNDDVLAPFGWSYPYNLLVDGNDDRGIDVGLFSRHPIVSVRSHIKDTDAHGVIFSRDCAEFEIALPSGQSLWLLGNHFKSKGYGSPAASTAKRLRQADQTRKIYLAARQRSPYVVVAGDLNDTPASAPLQALTNNTDMQGHEAMSHASYQGKPGTYATGNSLNQKIDYVFFSPELWAGVQAVGVERRGVWAPNTHENFPEVTSSVTQASDHAALWVDLAI
jgi:endonuclease/exonuclease/phosphatase family metal-dependent hydrolase